jgi:hypothetical protein
MVVRACLAFGDVVGYVRASRLVDEWLGEGESTE